MTFTRPTLAQLVNRLEASVRAELGGGPLLARGVLKALVRALAGGLHLQHGHLDYLSRQIVPTTKSGDHLAEWAAFFGLERKPAGFASGDVTFNGNEGAEVPIGTRVKRSDGVLYATTVAGTISGGSTTVNADAVEAGEDGNAAAGATLSLSSPVTGIGSSVTAPNGFSGGADEETDQALRDRLAVRLGTPPQGGAAADYVAWALEVPGVTRAWALPENRGAGTVDVTFAEDEGSTAPIPGAGLVASVQTKLDEERPVTADVLAFAPAAVALDPEIELTPDTAGVRNAVEAALEDLLLREAAPGATLYLSRIREAISLAAGEENHVLVSPVADITYTSGEIGTLGSITWS